MYIAHFLSLILYLAIPVIGIVSFFKARKAFEGYVLLVTSIHIGMSIMLASVFIILQLDWIRSNNNDVVGTAVSFWWLVFDYINAIGYIVAVSLIGMGADLCRCIKGKLVYYKQQSKPRLKDGVFCYTPCTSHSIFTEMQDPSKVQEYIDAVKHYTSRIKCQSDIITSSS